MPRLVLVRILLAALAAVAIFAIVSAALRIAVHDELGIRQLCTVAASSLLLVGAIAGLAGRTWGVLSSVVSSIAYGGAFLFGIAPPWFMAVAALGLGLAAAVAPPLWRRDPAAFVVALAIAIALGASAAALAGPGLELVWEQRSS